MTSETNVASFLLSQKPEDKVALELLSGNYTYGQLRAAVRSMACYLRSVGRQKGDRVLLLSDNSFFWVAAYLGTLHAGLVCVPLPTSLSARDLNYILSITEARLAVVEAGIAAKNAMHLRGTHLLTDHESTLLPGVLSQASFDELGSTPSIAQLVGRDVCPDDLAAIMFTSGSTGRPRGVMVSHRNIMANTESIIRYLDLTNADRIMTVLPFHYCFGTSLLHTHLRVGGSLVVDSRFMYSESILQRMLDTECTGFAGVPSHFQILLRGSSLRKKTFPHLHYVQQAGGHLAPTFVRELQEALPGKQIFVMYGQTEATARLSYLPPEFLDKKPGSIGKGIPGVRLHVLDELGHDVRPGEVGEIVAEGENITLGYWRAPEETARTFRDGKLHTGDMATVDEDGFIYVVDRAKDFLKCGGKRISCLEVESRLEEFQCVVEAAVLATPDDLLGEAVEAFLVPRMPDCLEFENCLLAFCKEHMQPQLIPRKNVLVPSLPKNGAGKVLKQNLRAKRAASSWEAKD